jgi:hypothetical protein
MIDKFMQLGGKKKKFKSKIILEIRFFLGSQSGIAKDSSLLARDTASLGRQFLSL